MLHRGAISNYLHLARTEMCSHQASHGTPPLHTHRPFTPALLHAAPSHLLSITHCSPSRRPAARRPHPSHQARFDTAPLAPLVEAGRLRALYVDEGDEWAPLR